MRFHSENAVFKFLRRSVNGKYLMRFQSETLFSENFSCVVWTGTLRSGFGSIIPFLDTSLLLYLEAPLVNLCS